ncbi:HPP family protein [Wenxinia marina]|uniref:CBS-domain-containing membrane protein n=1 Tax=Wenxinia marina DSM 24838 TaxID=1123501 RepID=A0A0D0QG40_9RHOB|nr:HPP family protein [Wenxinia marina]KIQ71187.1 CBS-domain-containing membrane protein [Wenxinia marina DSM 24838]
MAPISLVAPLGATAVLVFCVPNSPLAQPWSAVAGNVTASLVALAVVTLVPPPAAATVAVGAAIAAMMLIRALHPPGGAVALLTALDPAPVQEAGPLFALLPVGLTTAALVLVAMVWNRATGRRYPFRLPAETNAAEPAPRLGLSTEELGSLLSRFNQATNLGVADLGRLLAAAEAEAAGHRFDGTTCADIMTADPIIARPEIPVAEAAQLFLTHRIKCLPVVEGDGRLTGLLFQADLLDAVAGGGRAGRRSPRRRTVGDAMRPATGAVPHDMPVGRLLNRLAADGSEVVPVEREGWLAGILTRSDVIRLLLRGAEERPSIR